MGVRRTAALVAALIVVCCCGMAAAARAAATDGMLNLVPTDWPIVVRYDATDATASGAYLSKAYSDPDLKKMSESFNLGVAKLLASLGIEVPVQPDLIPWTTGQAVVAANIMPGGQTQFLKVVASTDAAAAEKWILDLSGSVFRNSEPRISEQSGARLIEWDLPELKIKPACAIGNGYVAFAESTATLKHALSDGDGPPAIASKLTGHEDDLMAFAVDVEAIMKSQMSDKPGQGEMSPAPAAMMAAGMQPNGGLSASENGFTFNVQSSASPAMAMMLASVVGNAKQGADASSSVPERALAVMQLASGKMLGMLKEPASEMLGQEQVSAGAAMAEALPDWPAAVAVMSLLPTPGFAVVAQAPQPSDVEAALARLKAGLQKSGLKAGAAKGGYQELKDGSAKSAGYIGSTTRAIFFASDLRTAKTLSQVTPGTSVTANKAYADMRALNGGPRLADMWLSLEGVSALSYMYEGMGANYFPLNKWIADSFKSTSGLGMSAGMTGDGAEVRVSLRTQPGPGSAITALNTGMLAGTAAVLFPVFARARGAAKGSMSLSNLKQLAMAARMYTADYDGRLPDPAKYREQLTPYVKDPEVFQSPFSGYEYRMNPSLKGLRESQITDPVSAILFYEINSDKTGDTPWESPDGMCRVAYFDGHVKQLPGAPAESQMKAGISPPSGKKTPKK